MQPPAHLRNSDLTPDDLVTNDARIPVYLLLQKLAAGESAETLLEAYPQLSRADLQAVWEYPARSAAELDLIHDDEHHQAVIEIDEQALPLQQFGKLLTTYAGWGMRIEFVPKDEVHRRPVLEVREPESEN